MTTNITEILQSCREDPDAAAERLLPVVYETLRTIARAKMSREAPQTLQPTALVHEAYLRLIQNNQDWSWENRRHFYAAAAEAMRRILIERARRQAAVRRGGHRKRVNIDPDFISTSSDERLLRLNLAIEKLEAFDARKSLVVKFRYFLGLDIKNTAELMALSPTTIKSEWAFAKSWLKREISSHETQLERYGQA